VDAGTPAVRGGWGEPLRVHHADTLDRVRAVLDAAYAEALAGFWCVGYVRYEAAPALESVACVHESIPSPSQPLVWFGVFQGNPAFDDGGLESPAKVSLDWVDTLPRSAFDAQVAHIQDAIRDGQVYQVNLTAQLSAHWVSDSEGRDCRAEALAFFAELRRAQPDAFAAYIDNGSEQILSVSPELFFDWDGQRIVCRPMKGTAARAETAAEDAQAAQALRASEKERAENLMIVDLIRNDLSRLALPHSVRVPSLFDVRGWPTVWQMTSDVVAQTRPGLSLSDVFAALFPCGSVTGAPKLQAMRLIRVLEAQARGVYCGAVGVLRPGGHATFNVPIRTVSLGQGEARYGVGSGITADSRADAEYAEWRSKRAFLHRASQPFELLETLAWRDGEFQNLNRHLLRMAAAAKHFGFVWNQASALQALMELEAQWCVADGATGMKTRNTAQRVRLCCDVHGGFSAQAQILDPSPERVRVQLALRPLMDAGSEFVRYKTTHRRHYEAFMPEQEGVFDTLLWNEAGELTEFTRGNVAVLLDGQWVTPPASCGLLPGVGRALALESGRVSERVVLRSELAQVSALAFINSVRGWIPAQWSVAPAL
jgi:para-aminobenzoate synthetase/4-amino-4-deoxychorismate lyase